MKKQSLSTSKFYNSANAQIQLMFGHCKPVEISVNCISIHTTHRVYNNKKRRKWFCILQK